MNFDSTDLDKTHAVMREKITMLYAYKMKEMQSKTCNVLELALKSTEFVVKSECIGSKSCLCTVQHAGYSSHSMVDLLMM